MARWPVRTSLSPAGLAAVVFRPAITDLRISASMTSTRLPSSARLLPSWRVTVVLPSFSLQLVITTVRISCPQNCRLVRSVLKASWVKKSSAPGSFKTVLFTSPLPPLLLLIGPALLGAIGPVVAVFPRLFPVGAGDAGQNAEAQHLLDILVGLDAVVHQEDHQQHNIRRQSRGNGRQQEGRQAVRLQGSGSVVPNS